MFDKLTKVERDRLGDMLMRAMGDLQERRHRLSARLRVNETPAQRLANWNARESVIAMRNEIGDLIGDLYRLAS